MERKKYIAPSLLAANFTNLDSELNKLKEANIKYLHYDVMDGHFVPNISFGPAILKQIKKYGFIYDVHLMVSDPKFYAEKFIESGADIITFHYEACNNSKELISYLRKTFSNIKIGISIKPKTDVNAIIDLIELVDLVLVMSVEPGFGGQKFMPMAIEKIKTIRKYILENNLNTLIEVDGGINVETAKYCIDAGVDILVAGTSVFKSDDIKKVCNDMLGE